MAKLFFTAYRQHNVGDILGGGNFGRAFDTYVFDPHTIDGAYKGWRLASELIFEDVRKAQYPHMPSRFTCSFAYPNEQEARKGMAGAAAGTPSVSLYLYEVELVDPSKTVHRVGFNLLSSVSRFANHVRFVPNNRALAHQYWSGQGITIPEVITESPFRVIAYLR